MCAKFLLTPKEAHLKAMKRVFKYFVGLSFPGGDEFELLVYFDVDYASFKVNRKDYLRFKDLKRTSIVHC